MIRLTAEKDSPEKTVPFSDRDSKRLQAFLTAIVEDDVETVKRCLDEGMPISHPNLYFAMNNSEKIKNESFLYLHKNILNVSEDIAGDDKRRGRTYPISSKLKGYSGVISACVSCLSVECLRYFHEQKLFFDAEPFIVPILNSIPCYDAEVSATPLRQKIREVLSILNQEYHIDPNEYIDAEAANQPTEELPLLTSHAAMSDNLTMYTKLMIPAFMYYAICGKEEIFNFMVDCGADLSLTSQYTNSIGIGSPFTRYTLREIAALNFSQDVVAAYLREGKTFTEKESIEMLELIFIGNSRMNHMYRRTTLGKDENLNTVMMLIDSVVSSKGKTKVFNLLYMSCLKDVNKIPLDEQQLYNLLSTMKELSPEKFRESVSLLNVFNNTYLKLLSEKDYRVARFIIENGIETGANVKSTYHHQTAAHKIVIELLRSTLRAAEWEKSCTAGIDFINFLIDSGLDLNIKDDEEKTAMDLCFKTSLSEAGERRFLPRGRVLFNKLLGLLEKQKQTQQLVPDSAEFVREW